MLGFLSRTLELEGFAVTSETQADRVAGLLLDIRPDLLITDTHMPPFEPFRALREVRELQVPLPPIIVLTGHDDPNISEQAMALGADLFLTKPCTRETLVTHVGQLLG